MRNLGLIQNSENKVFQVANNGNVKIGNTNPTNAKLSVDLNAAETNLHAFESNYTAAFDYSFANIFKVDRDLTKALAVFNTTTNKENIVLYGDGTANVRRVNINSEHNENDDAVLFLIQNEQRKVFQINNNGFVQARRFRIDQTTWADYVFDENYSLPSLTYVKNFVQINKHLPDVPSEEEVKRNGVDLADLNVILLKKIEELYLYSFQQRQELDDLRREIKELKDTKAK